MVAETRHLLLSDSDYIIQDPGLIFKINFRKLATIILSIPLVAFIFCILYSIIYNFESSTSTSCRAYNVLPSVSAAIGGYSPQKEIWKVAILIHSPPRYMMVYMYTIYNLEIMRERNFVLTLIISLLHFVENTALISLSLFDSSNYYPIHEKSFITFVFTSELYMLLMIVMQDYCRLKSKSLAELYGLKWKKILVGVNILSILIAMYYFIQHNLNCQDYDYSKFAVCEYIVVLSNMGYHFTCVYDFYGKDLILHKEHGLYTSSR